MVSLNYQQTAQLIVTVLKAGKTLDLNAQQKDLYEVILTALKDKVSQNNKLSTVLEIVLEKTTDTRLELCKEELLENPSILSSIESDSTLLAQIQDFVNQVNNEEGFAVNQTISTKYGSYNAVKGLVGGGFAGSDYIAGEANSVNNTWNDDR